jgi:hypothetical protein
VPPLGIHKLKASLAQSVSHVGDGVPTLLAGRFVVPAHEVQDLQRRFDVDEVELLMHLIAPASQMARPPVSHYHVG